LEDFLQLISKSVCIGQNIKHYIAANDSALCYYAWKLKLPSFGMPIQEIIANY